MAELQSALPAWTARLQVDLTASVRASAENVGHLEERIAERVREVARLALEEAAPRAHLEREIGYFENHRERLDYRDGKARGEPLGSGAMESTCRQDQCRFKRPGQFWTQRGDEALLCLETFWRNGRWKHLFPHVGTFDPSRN